MIKYRIIYIIGFMGSGKSTLGRKLAAHLGWSFIDLDKRIEEFTGKSISQIFAEDGEDYFRSVESEVLHTCGALTHTVISTGGGAPCHGLNMEFMEETGLIIYLKLTPGQLKSRLAVSKGDRPLIKGLPEDELLTFINIKLTSREKWYTRAAITLEGIDLNINSVEARIKSRLDI